MNCNRTLGERILAASGISKTSLVLRHVRTVNVLTETLERADIAIKGGFIVSVGSCGGAEKVNLGGMILRPGLTDGHIRLESSMVSLGDFCRAMLSHGTTTVVTDPHEVANMAGTTGIQYVMEAMENLDSDVFFVLFSCVPSTGLDESRAVLDATALESFYKSERVLGLAELMNSCGTVGTNAGTLKKVGAALASGELVDEHAPFLGGTGLNVYVTAGVTSGHECLDIRGAREKYAKRQWIMAREGAAMENLEALMSLFETPHYQRSMLVTDDKHPGDLIRYEHIDYIIRLTVKRGAGPI